MQEHLAQILIAAAVVLSGLLGAVVYLIVPLRGRRGGDELAGLLQPLQQDLTRLDQQLKQEFSNTRSESQQSIKADLGAFRDAQAKLIEAVERRVQALSDSNESRLGDLRGDQGNA